MSVSLKDQNKVLKKYFNIEVTIPKKIPVENPESDGLFLIPKWNKIGKTYNEAVIKLIEALKKDRPCYDYRNGNWGPEYLRALPRDIPEVVSAQLGKKYKGMSVENVRKNISKTETLMGIYEIGIVLLTNPKILSRYEDLWIDCPGDEYSPDAGSRFVGSPCFWFIGGKLGFDTRDVGGASEYCGSGSVFAPQSNLEPIPLDSFESLTLESRVKKIEEWIRKEANFINPFN